MFRGGEYYDQPDFHVERGARNNMDTSVMLNPLTSQDINGAQPKAMYQGGQVRDNMNVNDINGSRVNQARRQMPGEADMYLAASQAISNSEYQGKRSQESDVWSYQHQEQAPRRAAAPLHENTRSLNTNDIMGAYSVKHTGFINGVAAGVRNGSAEGKNHSTVFSHLDLSDNVRGDRLQRKDWIPGKPISVQGGLANQQYMPDYNSVKQQNAEQFRQKASLIQTGSNIFGTPSGSASSQYRNLHSKAAQQAVFEENYAKPLVGRSASFVSNQSNGPAGMLRGSNGQVPTQRIAVSDGKSRLFGLGEDPVPANMMQAPSPAEDPMYQHMMALQRQQQIEMERQQQMAQYQPQIQMERPMDMVYDDAYQQYEQ